VRVFCWSRRGKKKKKKKKKKEDPHPTLSRKRERAKNGRGLEKPQKLTRTVPP
jgi:hypothetical protein